MQSTGILHGLLYNTSPEYKEKVDGEMKTEQGNPDLDNSPYKFAAASK